MKTRPPLQLSRLRNIGWTEWDPIGLLSPEEVWENQPFADEYDAYLLEAAGRLRRDWNVDDATEYLLLIERDHIGLPAAPTSRSRAFTTANAIEAYLDEIDALA